MTEALKTVSSGFRLVYIGLLLVVLAVLINFIGGMILGRQGAGNIRSQLELVTSGLNLLGTIVGLVGRFKCMAVPREAGSAKQMIVISVAMEIVSLLIALVFLINHFSLFLPLELIVVVLAVLVMEITAAILFLLFTKETASYVRRPDLAATAMSVLWLWVTTLVLFVVAMGLMLGAVWGAAQAGGGGAVEGACVGAIIMIAGLVVGLVALIKYANLLIEMANATLKYSREAAYGFDDEDFDDGRAKARDDGDDWER